MTMESFINVSYEALLKSQMFCVFLMFCEKYKYIYVYIRKMPSISTLYRKEHLEYCAQERIREKERMKLLYHTNPENIEKN